MKKWMVFVAIFCSFSLAFAAEPNTGVAARTVIEQQAEQILADLATNQQKYASDPQAFQQFIARAIAPRLDFQKMAQIALGRHLAAVKQAGKLTEFTDAFRTLLIRVYSRGWKNYTQARVRVLGTPAVDQYNRAMVRVQVTGNNGKSAQMRFFLYYSNAEWKIYDATFENVSLMTSYRNTFDSQLQKGGVDALIARMRAMN